LLHIAQNIQYIVFCVIFILSQQGVFPIHFEREGWEVLSCLQSATSPLDVTTTYKCTVQKLALIMCRINRAWHKQIACINSQTHKSTTAICPSVLYDKSQNFTPCTMSLWTKNSLKPTTCACIYWTNTHHVWLTHAGFFFFKSQCSTVELRGLHE